MERDLLRLIWRLLVFTALIACPLCCYSNKRRTSIVTVEACEREGREKRFLKSEWIEKEKRFKISFRGNKGERGTKFIYTSKWIMRKTVQGTMQFSLRPSLFPDSFLAREGKLLVLKNLSNFEDKHLFQFSTATLQYRDAQRNLNVTEHYKIVRTRSKPLRVLKSSRNGKVSLDEWKDSNWRDCSSWFKMSTVL